MTKKHFEAFAAEIKAISMDHPTMPPGQKVALARVLAGVVERVANKFNPNFDRVKFRKACGLNSDDQQT